MVRLSDGNYHLAHTVTATQKEILKAFGMTAANIRSEASEINKELKAADGAEV